MYTDEPTSRCVNYLRLSRASSSNKNSEPKKLWLTVRPLSPTLSTVTTIQSKNIFWSTLEFASSYLKSKPTVRQI
jgi:hypothetical protein